MPYCHQFSLPRVPCYCDGVVASNEPANRLNGGFGVILELLLSLDTSSIREIAVERKEDVLDLRIHGVMQALDRIRTGGNRVERRLHLRHVFELEGDMELSELWRPKTKLAACDAVGVQLATLPQVF